MKVSVANETLSQADGKISSNAFLFEGTLQNNLSSSVVGTH
jgi:hypothetical protein